MDAAPRADTPPSADFITFNILPRENKRLVGATIAQEYATRGRFRRLLGGGLV